MQLESFILLLDSLLKCYLLLLLVLLGLVVELSLRVDRDSVYEEQIWKGGRIRRGMSIYFKIYVAVLFRWVRVGVRFRVIRQSPALVKARGWDGIITRKHSCLHTLCKKQRVKLCRYFSNMWVLDVIDRWWSEYFAKNTHIGKCWFDSIYYGTLYVLWAWMVLYRMLFQKSLPYKCLLESLIISIISSLPTVWKTQIGLSATMCVWDFGYHLRYFRPRTEFVFLVTYWLKCQDVKNGCII